MVGKRNGKAPAQSQPRSVPTITSVAPAIPLSSRTLRSHTQTKPMQAKRQPPEEGPEATRKMRKLEKQSIYHTTPVSYTTPAHTTVVNSQPAPYHRLNDGRHVPIEHQDTTRHHIPAPNPLHVINVHRSQPTNVPQVTNSYVHISNPNDWPRWSAPPPPSATPLPPYTPSAGPPTSCIPSRAPPPPAVLEVISDSDDEEEAPANEVSGVAVSTSVHQAPVQILDQHWSRNREPRPPKLTPLQTPAPPSTPLRMVQVLAPPPAPLTQVSPSSQPPSHSPAIVHGPTPTPLQSIADSMPTSTPLLTPAPDPQAPQMPVPLSLPIPAIVHLAGDPTKHGSWPLSWKKLLELARVFALNDLLFAHGFPTSFMLRNQAGEALTNAWDLYGSTYPLEPLDRYTYNKYRHSLRTIVLTDVRNHRAKLRDSIVSILQDEHALTGPGSSTETVAERAEHLIHQYRFFDAPYGVTRTPDVMYSSTILSKALVYVYRSKQWRAAMMDATLRNSEFPLVLSEPTAEESCLVCPPPSVVTFVGTLIINALLCCAAGFNSSRVPLVEADYRETYSLLSVFVEKDWNHPQLGQHVQSQLARSILSFRIMDPPTHD